MSFARASARAFKAATRAAAAPSSARAFSVAAQRAPLAAAKLAVAGARGVKTLSFAGVEETVYEVRPGLLRLTHPAPSSQGATRTHVPALVG